MKMWGWRVEYGGTVEFLCGEKLGLKSELYSKLMSHNELRGWGGPTNHSQNRP
jgi:hypothetical protein